MKKSPIKRRTPIKRGKKKLGKSKRLTIPRLRDKVWRVFSKYIRLKYSCYGYVICVTCGKQIKAIGEAETGHFRHGKDREFYFDEDNVHPQCTDCNNYHKDLAGKKYTLFMLDEYGEETVNRLLNAKKTTWKRPHLEELYEKYNTLLKELL